MFLKQTKSAIYPIICLLCVTPAPIFAMQAKNNNSDIHFYGNQRRNSSNAPKNTIDYTRSETAFHATLSMPIIPIIFVTPPLEDEAPLYLTSFGDSPQDGASLAHKKFTCFFDRLQKEAMSTDDRSNSLLMLKDTVYQERIKCLQERSNKEVLFADLERDIVLFLEEIEQKQAECFALQAQCLAAQPDLEDID